MFGHGRQGWQQTGRKTNLPLQKCLSRQQPVLTVAQGLGFRLRPLASAFERFPHRPVVTHLLQGAIQVLLAPANPAKRRRQDHQQDDRAVPVRFAVRVLGQHRQLERTDTFEG